MAKGLVLQEHSITVSLYPPCWVDHPWTCPEKQGPALSLLPEPCCRPVPEPDLQSPASVEQVILTDSLSLCQEPRGISSTLGYGLPGPIPSQVSSHERDCFFSSSDSHHRGAYNSYPGRIFLPLLKLSFSLLQLSKHQTFDPCPIRQIQLNCLSGPRHGNQRPV